MLHYYSEHQIEVIVRKTRYELKKAEERAHILAGLKIALDHIDEIITLIRNSRDNQTAMVELMERFNLSEIQARAILDMQLRRLSGLERQKIEDEYNNLMVTIADLKDILANHSRVVDIIKTDLLELKEKYGDKRRTEIVEGALDIEDEDLIPVEDIVITMTTNGYIKRIPVDTYKTQNRGGKGIKGMSVNEDDIIDQFLSMSTHEDLLMFSNKGKVYRIRGYRVPMASRTAKGIPVVNLLNLDKDEKIKAMVRVYLTENISNEYLFFVTKDGLVKRTPMTEFENIRQTGKIAITLKDGDELVAVKQTMGEDEIGRAHV